MKKGRNFIALLLLLSAVITVALSGCAGDRADSANDDDISDKPVSTALNVGLAKDLDDSLDPHKMVSAGTKEVLFNVFEGLVKPSPDGNLIPAVAENYTVSEDRLTYTFTLREGVKFHNGEAVTAADVVYSIKRCAGLLAEEPEALVTAFSVITDVHAEDDRTVVISISAPDLDFVSYLTAAIIPENYAEQATAPVGTGPFVFVSRSAQENIVLKRFDEYWGEKPYLTDVTFRIITQDTIVTSLRSGAIDMCAHLTPAQAAEVSGQYDVVKGGMNSVLGIYLNNAVAPLDNIDVRRALCHAVNVDEVMALVFDGEGTPVGSSMYPAFGKYFDESLVGTYAYDVETAKQLLADAGYPNGFELKLTVASNVTQYVETAQVVAEQLKAINVIVNIELVEWETWVSDIYIGRNYEATIIDFDASTMTARALLERFTSASSKNISYFASDDYDAAFTEAITATDDATQIAAYKRCQAILAEQAANVYLMDMADMVAIRSDLTGYTFYPIFVVDLAKIAPKAN